MLGLASSGLHSNGYSFARKLFSKKEIIESQWGKLLLRPTKIYVKPILSLISHVDVKSICHITGGGLYENLPRVIPSKYSAFIDKHAWPIPPIFKEMQKRGNVDDYEMYRTFNMGIGMVVIMNEKNVATAQSVLKKFKIKSWVIGNVTSGDNTVIIN